MPTSRMQLGAKGESLVASHLQAQGYRIIERNWRCPGGELDIVACQGNEWVFVEVRTRRAQDTDAAIESVTAAKQNRILAAVHTYLEVHDLEDATWRVDLAVVALGRSGPHIEVIRDAIGW